MELAVLASKVSAQSPPIRTKALPKAAADGARFIKQLRTMAAGAKQELADSAGLDVSEAMDAVKGLADLHPRRIATNMLKDEPASPKKPAANAPLFDPDAT